MEVARQLTELELRILALVGSGSRNQDIADSLGTTPVEVRRHLRELCQVFGVQSREELQVRASEGTRVTAICVHTNRSS